MGDGYIKHFDGRLKDNTHVGWADVRTGDPVDDKNIFGKYEKAILEKVEQTIEELDWSKHNALKSMREGERVSSCTDCAANEHI